MVRLSRTLETGKPLSTGEKRRMIAELCKLWGMHVGAVRPAHFNGASKAAKLPRRLRQTLQYLLSGDSEKQVASKMRLSRHTVHNYTKMLYRRYGVNSRGELLAKFLRAK